MHLFVVTVMDATSVRVSVFYEKENAMDEIRATERETPDANVELHCVSPED
jgi:hypothetical protein